MKQTVLDVFFGHDKPGYGRTLDLYDYFVFVISAILCYAVPWFSLILPLLCLLLVLVEISKHGDTW